MKSLTNMLMFAAGVAAGAGAYKGIEAMNKNKYQVKKKINSAIDNMTSTIK